MPETATKSGSPPLRLIPQLTSPVSSMFPMIPVNEPLLDGNEEEYLVDCIRTAWIGSEGPYVSKFEERFSSRVNRAHGVAVCNGTAALDAAIEAAGIQSGDEVILPTFTIISCIHQIVRIGAVPVLVDSDPVTWNMDVAEVAQKITRRTKAILAVHIYGLPVDMDPIIELGKEYGLVIIEDSAEMIGQTYYGRPCGSLGDISTFSFYPNKHVTTGEGGMIVTDSDEYAAACRSLRNLCFQPEKRFVHERLGWNLRMTNMQAAIGVAQLERLDEFLKIKRRNGRRYRELLADLDGIQLPLERTAYATNVYWVFGIVLEESTGLSAADCMAELSKRGVGCRPFFFPMHLQPVLRRRGLFHNEDYPVAERLYRQGFYIPSGLALTDAQTTHVAEVLCEILQ